jgi:hypothetical protein
MIEPRLFSGDLDCWTRVGADLRVGPPNGRTHGSAPTIASCLLPPAFCLLPVACFSHRLIRLRRSLFY